MVKRCKGLVLMCVYWIKPSSVICLYKANLTLNFTVDECFTLRHLNCNSFVISVPSLHLAFFFPPLPSYRTTKGLTLQREYVEGKEVKTVKFDNSVVPIMAFMSCGYEHKLSNLSGVGNTGCRVCVCTEVWFLMFCEFMCILSVY